QRRSAAAAWHERATEGEHELEAQQVAAAAERAFIAREGRVRLSGPHEAARERERRRRVVGRSPRTRDEDGPRDTIGNTDERDDIARVVLEDRGDDRRVTVTEVIEVRIRNERAGDIGGPRVVEDAVFELFQRRRAEPVAPETPRGVEQV